MCSVHPEPDSACAPPPLLRVTSIYLSFGGPVRGKREARGGSGRRDRTGGTGEGACRGKGETAGTRSLFTFLQFAAFTAQRRPAAAAVWVPPPPCRLLLPLLILPLFRSAHAGQRKLSLESRIVGASRKERRSPPVSRKANEFRQVPTRRCWNHFCDIGFLSFTMFRECRRFSATSLPSS